MASFTSCSSTPNSGAAGRIGVWSTVWTGLLRALSRIPTGMGNLRRSRQTMVPSEMKQSARCRLNIVVALAVAQLMLAGGATAQTAPSQTDTNPSRFLIGPLGWTPTLTLRDAGVDSNVFNTPSSEPAKQDVTGSLSPSVESLLTLGVMQLATQGRADFVYFERYANERAINGRVAGRMQFPTTHVHPIVTGSWERA